MPFATKSPLELLRPSYLPLRIRPLSLRWRLTLWSSLIIAIVFGIFLTLAFLFVNTVTNILYSPIDDYLRAQTTVNMMQIRRTGVVSLSQSSGGSPFGAVYYALIDANGKTLSPNAAVPSSDESLTRALNGTATFETATLPDGSRLRVYLQPFLFDVRGTGQEMVVLQAATRLDIPDQILQQLTGFVFGAGIALLVVAAAGSYIVSGRALQVVNRVTRRARQIGTSGDLSQRIPAPSTNDEIGQLVQTFNQMLSRLEDAFTTQRRFVADSSHELRTPLTVIRGNLHLLRRTEDPAERRELIDITEGEISRLNRMVDDLLYIAQMQAGYGLKPILNSVELDSLLLEVFALSRSMGALKEQKVVLAHEAIATTYGDRDQLQHLLLNLVDNAIKYTPEHGSISLGLWAENEWVRFQVSDTGPGIPESDVPLLFDRFFRTAEARSSAREGSGLGLAIVKSIAEAHNGRVEVFSKVGEGTTFRVWLPAVSTGGPAIDVDEVEAVEVTEDEVQADEIGTVSPENVSVNG